MDGLWWKTLLKWMIWGYHYFWKHPYIVSVRNVDVFWWHRLSAFRNPYLTPKEWCIRARTRPTAESGDVFFWFFLCCHQWVKVCVPAMFIQIRQQTHVCLALKSVKCRWISRQVPTWLMKMTYPGLLASTLGVAPIKKPPHFHLFGKMVWRDEILYYLGGGNSKFFFNFHPEIWGRWTQFDDSYIFQLGWFIHTSIYYTNFILLSTWFKWAVIRENSCFFCILTLGFSYNKAANQSQQPLDVDFDPRSYMMTREYHWRVLHCPLLVGLAFRWVDSLGAFGGWVSSQFCRIGVPPKKVATLKARWIDKILPSLEIK